MQPLPSGTDCPIVFISRVGYTEIGLIGEKILRFTKMEKSPMRWLRVFTVVSIVVSGLALSSSAVIIARSGGVIWGSAADESSNAPGPQGVTFDRLLSGDKVGQHKAPPLSQVAVEISVSSQESLFTAALADYFPVSWTVLDAGGGNVSAVDDKTSRIEWPIGNITAGETVTLTGDGSQSDLILRLVAKQPDGTWIAQPDSDEETFELLERVGRVPLPPYIRKGEMIASDRQRYQTVYAHEPGSVAAPTAGLHFTEQLLEQIAKQGIGLCRMTLHVGLGTFRPITSETLADHQMHAEWGTISPQAVEQIARCRDGGGKIVAVGTTSARLLETAAAGGGLRSFSGKTDLFIRPPYEFRAIDAMLTNFHLPRTTLLVLVRTFGGDELICRAYEEAVREEYRFYSYGDAMLIV